MKRILFGLLIGLLLGGAAGFGGGIFIYPFWFLNEAATEVLQDSERGPKLATGTFIHANPSDPIHWGKGKVTVYGGSSDQPVLHLEPSFQVGPGPRFHIYLVKDADITGDAAFEASEKLDLGRLRAFRGSQVYRAPPGTAIADYRSVVIWCKEFKVLISPANLAHQPGA